MPKVTTSRGIFWVADQRKDKSKIPSIVIHGAGGTHLSFPKELRQSNIINPLLIDLNGHGLSTGDGHENLSDHVEDIISVMDALNIPQTNLIGHSMGGAISQLIALDHSDRVQRLILLGTGGKFEVNAVLINGIVDNPTDTIQLLNKWMWSKSVPDNFREMSAEMMSKLDPYTIQRDYIAANEFDVLHRLYEVKLPALVIASRNDKMVDLDLSQQLADKLPNAQLYMLSDAGHMLHLEQPEYVTKLIEDWLKEEIM